MSQRGRRLDSTRAFLQAPGPVSHITPDRITRQTSPCRRVTEAEGQEVVPRIPQPYRTSFSAITTPRRVQRDAGGSTSQVSRKTSDSKQPSPAQLTVAPVEQESPLHKVSPEVAVHISPPSSSQSSSRSSKKSEHSAVSVIAVLKETPESAKVEQKDYLKPERRASSGTGRSPTSPGSSTATHSTSSSSSHRSETHSSSSSRHSSSPRPSTSKESDSEGKARPKKKSSDSYIDNYPEITEETVDSVFTDNAPHASITSGEVEVPESRRSPSPYRHVPENEPSSPIRSSGFHSTDTVLTIDSEVRKKEGVRNHRPRVIEKEYVIDYVVDYNNVKNVELKIKANKETEELVQDMMGSRSSESTLVKRPLAKRDSSRSKASSAPSTPKASRKEQGRPPLQPISGRGEQDSPKVKKSLSASITNFFRRMSPKQLRRSPRGSGGNTPDSSTSSLQNPDTEHDSGTDREEPRRRRSRTRSPKSPLRRFFSSADRHRGKTPPRVDIKYEEPSSSDTKENLPSPTSTGQAGQPKLSTSAVRILRSIEDNTSKQEKSIYQSFKEKQSPKHSPEALSLKSQALKVVEISQAAIESSPEVRISQHRGSEQLPSSPRGTDTVIKLDRAGTLPKSKAPEVRSRKSLEPPKSLAVREVSKLAKGTGYLYTTSHESIGQCSLDVYATGSNPSITSGNGRHSAMTVSKRTLTSQDNITGSRSASGEGEHGQEVVTEEPKKLPSYVKLSCSVSGYNKYSTYVHDRESRTSHKTPAKGADSHCEQNGCGTPPLANGHAPLDIIGSDEVAQPVRGRQRSHGSQSDTDHVHNGSGPMRSKESGHVSVKSRTSSQSDYVPDRTVPASDLHLYSNSEEHLGLHLRGVSEKTSPCNGVSLPGSDNVPTPNKDGHYYISVMDQETSRLKRLCAQAESDLKKDLSEEASGKLRAAVGKANLLMNKKFRQFHGLCEKNVNPPEDDPFTTTNQDLAGFWDMVFIQVEDVNAMFEEIDLYRKNGWKTPLKQKNMEKTSGTPVRSPRSKVKPAHTAERTKKAEEAAKAREEARKRLIAAKKKGRERKASQSDEIEIYVNQ